MQYGYGSTDIEENVKQDAGDEVPGLHNQKGEDQADGDGPGYLGDKLERLVSAKDVYDVAEAEGDAADDHSPPPAFVLFNGLKQIPTEQQFFQIPDVCHQQYGYQDVSKTKGRIKNNLPILDYI